jgi:hypothetical protein
MPASNDNTPQYVDAQDYWDLRMMAAQLARQARKRAVAASKPSTYEKRKMRQKKYWDNWAKSQP